MKVHHLEGNMVFACPGCGQAHAVRIEELPGSGRPVWDFNGDVDAPTFSPSYLYEAYTWEPQVTPANLDAWRAAPWEQTRTPKVCHSFIVGGQISFLSDSTHFLAGQTVDLAHWNMK